MNIWLVILFIILIIMYSITLYVIYKRYKETKTKLTWWPVLHRLDSNNRLQYSIDGKFWTYVMGFEKNHDYGTYKGPGFGYIIVTPEELDSWSSMLYTLQKCHEWNKSALEHYREAIETYLETK